MLDSAYQGNTSGMEKALQQGAAIYSSNSYGRSALHFAAMCRRPSGAEAVRWLLERGLPWNAADSDEQLPEHLATTCGNVESAKILREWAIREGSLVSLMNCFITYENKITRCIISHSARGKNLFRITSGFKLRGVLTEEKINGSANHRLPSRRLTEPPMMRLQWSPCLPDAAS